MLFTLHNDISLFLSKVCGYPKYPKYSKFGEAYTMFRNTLKYNFNT